MNQIWSRLIVSVIIVCALPVQPMAAQDKKENDKKNDTAAAAGTPSAPQTVVTPDAVTEKTINAGGQTITYRAVAGTLTVGSNDVQEAMLGPDGKQLASSGETSPEQATARMFYIAYFNKEAGAKRPITFIYNGGPGGSSLPLHIGAFGPRRVVVPDAELDPGGTYNIINNDYTLLDASDIVFIDYPGVGTNVMPDLAYAMKLNPGMRVMLTGGYYDLATPFFEGIYEMHQLPLPKNLQANISYHYYASGHMVYVHDDALKQFHSDVAAFIKETENGESGNLR
jgi:carboxypeptidase C (cathepsin A)